MVDQRPGADPTVGNCRGRTKTSLLQNFVYFQLIKHNLVYVIKIVFMTFAPVLQPHLLNTAAKRQTVSLTAYVSDSAFSFSRLLCLFLVLYFYSPVFHQVVCVLSAGLPIVTVKRP